MHNPNETDSETLIGLSKAIGAMVALTVVFIVAANVFFGA